MINIEFKSTRELIKAFPDEQTCISHLEQLRWSDGVVSPFDEASKVYVTARGYKCKNTGKYFNVRTYTLFDNTKVELQTWFIAIYLATANKKDISSLQLSRDLNITQKTAWFMLQRIRNCFCTDTVESDIDTGNELSGSGGIVEVAETMVRENVKNMDGQKCNKMSQKKSDGHSNKTAILGLIKRGNRVCSNAIKSMDSKLFNTLLSNCANRLIHNQVIR